MHLRVLCVFPRALGCPVGSYTLLVASSNGGHRRLLGGSFDGALGGGGGGGGGGGVVVRTRIAPHTQHPWRRQERSTTHLARAWVFMVLLAQKRRRQKCAVSDTRQEAVAALRGTALPEARPLIPLPRTARRCTAGQPLAGSFHRRASSPPPFLCRSLATTPYPPPLRRSPKKRSREGALFLCAPLARPPPSRPPAVDARQ